MTEDERLREQVKATMDIPRFQLAIGVMRIHADWKRTRRVTGLRRFGEISLECRSHVWPVADLPNKVGRVNAVGICGASASHLLIKEVVPVTNNLILIKLLYGMVPWYPHPAVDQTADFAALLEALEAGAGAGRPERAETWRDRPPLL
jgi:hypothetical protein